MQLIQKHPSVAQGVAVVAGIGIVFLAVRHLRQVPLLQLLDGAARLSTYWLRSR